MSFGGGAFRSNTPLYDSSNRRGTLDGQHRRSNNDDESANKLPFRAANPPVPSMDRRRGMNAVDRIRARRLQHQQQHQQQLGGASADCSFTSLDGDDDTHTTSRFATTTTTARPNTNRRQSIMAFGRPMQSQNLLAGDSFVGVTSTAVTVANNSLNNSLAEDSNEPMNCDTVEGAGLRSSLRQLKQRVEQLEQEKMSLTMSKAPLEARFRQEKDAWNKEHVRLLQELDNIQHGRVVAENKCRDLTLRLEATETEMKELRFEVRKASSTHQNNMNNSASSWSQRQTERYDKDIAELKDEVRMFSLEKVSMEKELDATKMKLAITTEKYDQLEHEYQYICRDSSDNRDAEIQLEVLKNEHIATSAQLNAVCADLAATKARAEATIEGRDQAHKKETDLLKFEISVQKERAGKYSHGGTMSNHGAAQEEDEAVWKARIEERDRRIEALELEVLNGEELRRQMHNRIQELRGNVRVYVRARPFLPDDGQATEPAIDVSPDGESLSIVDRRNDNPHDFKFDKVFPPSSGQDQVFHEVADFVQSALDGYQVCLFSYGQTGSGKTHTMQGSGNSAMRGIIPRAVEQILNQAIKMKKQKWDFRLSASFLEIYNENLNDLLLSMSDKAKSKEPPKLAIKRDRAGKSYVENLAEITIDTEDSSIGMQQLGTLMAVAARARSVASTKMNAQSSRSHSVFMLHIRGSNVDSGAEVQGCLNLCDLAGSERLDRSGAGSDVKRLKETQAINKSLSCLGDVFNALGQRASHVPYRNSKLTYLLQDCLSGDGKALMFVNLSPTTASSGESLCSLRFAQRVNQVELGKPTKNIQYNRS
jgi:kinesin family protein C1